MKRQRTLRPAGSGNGEMGPGSFIFPHRIALGESQVNAVQVKELSYSQGSLNKRLLPLYGPVGQEEAEREGLQVERYRVKVEKNASPETPDKEYVS